jgi:hypothetical protein
VERYLVNLRWAGYFGALVSICCYHLLACSVSRTNKFDDSRTGFSPGGSLRGIVLGVEQDQYLRVFVSNLQEKLETNPTSPRYIVAELWVGYRINPNE